MSEAEDENPSSAGELEDQDEEGGRDLRGMRMNGKHFGADSGGDNDGAFPYDLEEFIRKLQEVPELPPIDGEENGCGASAPEKSYKDWSFPVGERLTVNTLSGLDNLKKTVPLPEGRIPPMSLPTWHFLPMEKKVPLVQAPKGLLYYTRGKLGKRLQRPTIMYTFKDPLNIERVPGGPYCSLHDPHARPYLSQPTILSLLRDQGFINDRREVLCSLREFNKFRDYLRTQYNDELWKLLQGGENVIQAQREQWKAIMKEESDSAGKGNKRKERIENAKRYQADAMEYRKKKAQQLEQMNASRLREWQTEKERKVIEHILKSIEQQKRNNERIAVIKEMRLQRRRDIMTKSTRKFLETEERTQNDKAMMEAAYNKFLLEWIESKYVYCYEKLIQKKQLQYDLTASVKWRANKRQRRLERYREQMPYILQKRKENEERIWGLVRKYAMRWLEKVRAKMNAPKDVKHESCWTGSKGVLDDTVKYLYQESGYEKLDDFILNIMKLKKQIQAQIELEEAEEAAALAAAQGGEDGSDLGGCTASLRDEFDAGSDT